MILEFKSDFDAKKKSVLIYQLFDKICTFFKVQFFYQLAQITFYKEAVFWKCWSQKRVAVVIFSPPHFAEEIFLSDRQHTLGWTSEPLNEVREPSEVTPWRRS